MAISKLYRIVEEGTGSKTHIVKGFESAKIRIEVTGGELLLGMYGSSSMEGAISVSDSNRPEAYYKKKAVVDNLLLTKGIHEVFIDLTSLSRLLVLSIPRDTFNGKVTFSTSYDKLYENVKDESIITGGNVKRIKLPENSKQIDISILNTDINPIGYYRFKGTMDGHVWEEVKVFDSTLETISSSLRNYLPVKNGLTKVYLNVEKYIELEISIDINVEQSVQLNYKISDTYIDRELPIVPGELFSTKGFLNGYRYLIIDLSGEKVEGQSKRIFSFPKDIDGNNIPYTMYNSNMEITESYMQADPEVGVVARIFGNIAKGKVIMEIHGDAVVNSLSGTSSNVLPEASDDSKMLRVKLTNTRPEREKKVLLKDKTDYRIYEMPHTELKKDVFHSDVLEYSNTILKFYAGGYHGIRYDIDFNIENVPALKEGENILFAFLLPFNINNRGQDVGQYGVGTRISVFTNLGRIFHNFPVRKTGALPYTDLFKFDESTIYNRFKKWLPVNDKLKVDSTTKYFPVLAEYDYSQFEGRVEGTPGYVDHFNTGGLKVDSRYRFFDVIKTEGRPFGKLTYGNIAKDPKMTIFANYNGVAGSEPIAIGTGDGGRTWNTKAYFACTDYYPNMRGGNIDFTPITDVAGAYVSNSLRIGRKRFNTPTAEIKDPTTPFLVNEEDKSLVTSMSVVDGTVQITTAENLNYDGSYPIVYFENVSANTEWDYICNDGFNASGSINNGIFFRAEKVATNKYKLYGDIGNPYEGDMVCRHLHSINRTQSGYLISTGESYVENGSYQGGFLYFLPQTHRNGTDAISVLTNLPSIRLTSSNMGVNRTSGAYLMNNSSDPDLIFVSDDTFAYSNKRNIKLAGREVELPVSPIGIYKGKLSDIDDLSKFECICEAKSTLISMVNHMGNFAADGFGEALCISKGGYNWNIETDEKNKRINGTDLHGNIHYGNRMIEFK